MALNKMITAAAPVVGGIIGAFGQKKREQRAHDRNLQYLDIQQKNTMEQIEKQRADQMKMWNETNYGAQVEHMKKAGLNVGLMYEGGGQGGQLGGSAGGSAGLATPQTFDIRQAAQESAMAAAQIANIKAQTEKTKAEAERERFDNTVRSDIGTEEYTEKVKSELAKERAQNKYEYRRADNIVHVLNSGGKSYDRVIDEFGTYDDNGNWQKLGQNEARKLIADWDRFKAEVDNINQKTAESVQGVEESKSRESLNKVEEQILDFKSNLTDLGLNETTVRIIEMIMKTLVGRR